jgi:hypothetical protein
MNEVIMMEKRFITAQECRVQASASQPARVEGYAAVFNVLSDDLGGFREIVFPGAFTQSLSEDDIRAVLNHNTDLVLGRNRAGTLRLMEDEFGLKFSLDLPETQAGRDLLISMQRGDISQMSFGFEARKDEWKQDSNGLVTRNLIDVKLWEISPVVFPAYPQTSANVRSRLQEFKQPNAIDQADSVVAAAARAQARLEQMQRRLQISEKEI